MPVLRRLGLGLVWVLTPPMVLWVFGALWFDFPVKVLAKAAARLWVAALAAVLAWQPLRTRALRLLWSAFGLALLFWLGIPPRQDRDWRPEVSRLASAEVSGDKVVFRNVRNFGYRSLEDFTPRWETRELRLGNLRGVDLFVTYWGSDWIAHPILSFDFGPDGRICFSIETRQEKGEGYSSIAGFYRQFELTYVVADERDVIRLRSNIREGPEGLGEEVYLYRFHTRRAREMFLEYVHAVNRLDQRPEWYHALTNNCTTAMRDWRVAEIRPPLDWRMLANGYGDQLLYKMGLLEQSLPFDELKKRSFINPKARELGLEDDFSSRIREGLPGF